MLNAGAGFSAATIGEVIASKTNNNECRLSSFMTSRSVHS